MRQAVQKGTAAAALAAWHQELQHTLAARCAAEELYRKACRARASAAFAALRQHAHLSAAAEREASALAHRRHARLRHALTVQGRVDDATNT